jgi:exo-beta-1,3-glucanase (GH17 family)
MIRNLPAFMLAAAVAILISLGWSWPNRPQDPPGAVPGEKFESLSYEPCRPGESPLNETYSTTAEVDADLALLAKHATAVRTYAAIKGDYDIAPIAKKHGLKLWQGIWVGADLARNERELARGIAQARAYPDTITRVVVGNEVLLRRDLTPAALIAYIERVRAAVKQPVAYADVWDFWKQFPEVANHVDIMLIHLLPYWEDVPTNIDDAVSHVGAAYREMKTLFPGKTIGIGETGWPSRGRQREGAVPGLVEETKFLRQFMTLSRAEHFDYNFIEAFDQDWKYSTEGMVGPSWGVFTGNRALKIPLSGPVREDPDWQAHAALGIIAGFGLTALGLMGGRSVSQRRREEIAVIGMLLGAAWGFAAADADGTFLDLRTDISGIANLSGQALLACLVMLRLAEVVPPMPWRRGAATSRVVRDFVVRRKLPALRGLLEDTCFAYAWIAALTQLLLVFGARYREFPLGTFAVPLITVGVRAWLGDLRRADGRREEFLLAGVLVLGAAASLIEEGYKNVQSIEWNIAVLVIAAPLLLRCLPGKAAPSAAFDLA